MKNPTPLESCPFPSTIIPERNRCNRGTLHRVSKKKNCKIQIDGIRQRHRFKSQPALSK